MERKKVAIIGGNGFIGHHLVSKLLNDHEVRVFDRPGSHTSGGAIFYSGDLAAGPGELAPCLEGCSSMVYLVHLAGRSPHSDPDMLALVRNLELFLIAMEAAAQAKVPKIIFFSSGGAVYGLPRQIPIPEDHPLDPISAYGLCKLTMEKYLALFCKDRGMEHVIVRPSNPFGPGQDFRRLQGVISVFTHQILLGQPLEVWGDGKDKKDYFAVEDLGTAVASLIRHPDASGAFNVGCGKGFSLLEIIDSIETATGKKATVVFKERHSNDVPEFVLNCSKLQSLTAWRPNTSFHEGIQKTADWMRQNAIVQ